MSTSITANARTEGFTLVELMVVVALVAIIAAIGYPSFTEFSATQRVRAGASALYDSLLLARSEAVKRNTLVSMTVTNLANGWTIRDPSVAPPLDILRTQEPFAGVQFTPVNPSIAYNRFGRPPPGSSPAILIASPPSSKSRCVTIDTVGRPHVLEGVCPP